MNYVHGAVVEAFVHRLEDLVTDPSFGAPLGWCKFPDLVRNGERIPRLRPLLEAFNATCHDLRIWDEAREQYAVRIFESRI